MPKPAATDGISLKVPVDASGIKDFKPDKDWSD